jgi:serine protease Do
MENGRQLRINVYSKGAGEQVTLDVRRGARALSIRVPVVERATDTSRLEDLIGSQQPVPNLGITVLDLTPAITQVLPDLRRDKGAVIARVTPDVPFSQQGKLMPGDVIYSLNGKTIESGADLRAVAATLKPATAAVLHIERDGILHYVAFRVER